MAHWQAKLTQAIDHHFEQLVALRRHLHARPELSGEEHATSAYLFEQLSPLGLSLRFGPNQCGVIAEPVTDDSVASVPRLALRADIDALPIQDQKQCYYRSQANGVMHACGHDAHTATLMGAVLGLQAVTGAGALPWPIAWRAIFQPAEETGLGALGMIEAGCLEGVRAILAVHVDPGRAVGRIGLRAGVLTANCDDLEIQVIGRGGHAARPHETIDPIAAVAQLITLIHAGIPRAIDSQDAVVVTIGQIIGGDNANVIPDRVRLLGTLRSLVDTARDQAVAKLQAIAAGVGTATGATIDVRVIASARNVRNDSGLIRVVEHAAQGIIGAEQIDQIARPSMGAEDFAYYLDQVPGAMVRLGCAAPGAPYTALHTPAFDIDERCIAIGAKLLARTVIESFREKE